MISLANYACLFFNDNRDNGDNGKNESNGDGTK